MAEASLLSTTASLVSTVSEPVDTKMGQTVTAETKCEYVPIHSASSDFYLYVNHAWLNDPKNKIPDEYSKWGGFVKLFDQSLKDQINLVQNLCDKKDKTEEEKKVTAIWKASMNR